MQQNLGKQFYRAKHVCRTEVATQTGSTSHTLSYISLTASACDRKRQCKASLKCASLCSGDGGVQELNMKKTQEETGPNFKNTPKKGSVTGCLSSTADDLVRWLLSLVFRHVATRLLWHINYWLWSVFSPHGHSQNICQTTTIFAFCFCFGLQCSDTKTHLTPCM